MIPFDRNKDSHAPTARQVHFLMILITRATKVEKLRAGTNGHGFRNFEIREPVQWNAATEYDVLWPGVPHLASL